MEGVIYVPSIIIPYYLPQAYSLLEHYRQTTFFYFFFPLSARGPTRRRNSTGLAELWGGWPIKQGEVPSSHAHINSQSACVLLHEEPTKHYHKCRIAYFGQKLNLI